MNGKLAPGQIRHGLLQTLADGKAKSIEQIAAGLREQKRKFQFIVISARHLPYLKSEGLIEWDTKVTLTLEGASKLADLDRKTAPANRGNLVRARTTSCMDYTVYDGAELKRNEGIPAERYAAFDLPSVAMGRRTWPDGRSEKLDMLGR